MELVAGAGTLLRIYLAEEFYLSGNICRKENSHSRDKVTNSFAIVVDR
jgi:hypothetical protein